MSNYQAQRHEAAMLVHQVGSGIEMLGNLPIQLLLENRDALFESYFLLGSFILRLSEIELIKNKQLQSHQ